MTIPHDLLSDLRGSRQTWSASWKLWFVAESRT